MKTIKLNLMILLGILATGFAAFGNRSDAQPKMNGKLKVTTLSPEEIRYTGKPYNKELGAYVFNVRNYSPEMSRWSTPDPSGFPDGANNSLYVNNKPSCNIDRTGKQISLYDIPAYLGVTHAFIYYDVYDCEGNELTGTFEAGPANPLPGGLLTGFGNLVSNPNDNLGSGTDVKDIDFAAQGYAHEYCLYKDIAQATLAYANDLAYAPGPIASLDGLGGYNSNGYISGILSALGITGVSDSSVGWDTPIPLSYTPQYADGTDCCE